MILKIKVIFEDVFNFIEVSLVYVIEGCMFKSCSDLMKRAFMKVYGFRFIKIYIVINIRIIFFHNSLLTISTIIDVFFITFCSISLNCSHTEPFRLSFIFNS